MKRVPAPGARINITADGQAVDTAFLGFTTSPHEECAVEAAVQLVEQHGGEATVLTLGPAEAEEQLRYAASVGRRTPSCSPPTAATGIRSARRGRSRRRSRDLEAADGPFDLILFGNESADSGGFQVGIRVAHALGRPMVNGAKGITVADGGAEIWRESDAGREVYELPLPAVVGVKEGINLPRYPTMKGRLASKKVEVANVTAAAEPGGQQMVPAARAGRAGVEDRHARIGRRCGPGGRRPARGARGAVK